MALMLALLVVALSLLLLLAFLDAAGTDLQLSNNYVRYLRAGYAAHAGIESALGRLAVNPSSDLTETDVPRPAASSVSYSVSATGSGPITGTSTGDCAGVRRVVHAMIEISDGKPILTRYWEN
ncbi:MAG: hypothetical protein ACE5O2_01145 [Armatimonadota bacterium]